MPSNVVPIQQCFPPQCEQPPCAIPPWGPFSPPWFGPQQPPWYPGANAGVTFSLTAPVNVIRGHFWWNGLTLQMFDGAAWVTVGGQVATAVVAPSAPPNPTTGLFWYDTTGVALKLWNGTAWIAV